MIALNMMNTAVPTPRARPTLGKRLLGRLRWSGLDSMIAKIMEIQIAPT
jgi:hypothetical protein